QVGSPLRHRTAQEVVERPVPVLPHPVGLVLPVGDLVNDLVGKALLRLLGIVRLVVPAVLVALLQPANLFVLREDGVDRLDCHGHSPLRNASSSSVSGAGCCRETSLSGSLAPAREPG